MKTFRQICEDAGVVGATAPGQWSDVGGSAEFLRKMGNESRPKWAAWDGDVPTPDKVKKMKWPFGKSPNKKSR